MAEENVIQTNIVATSNMSGLISDLNRVSLALSKLQEQLNVSNKSLAMQVSAMNKTFAETLRSTGQFSTQFVSLTTDVDKFGQQLDKGQLKLSQFFRVYGQHTKTTGGLIRDLAKQQVQLQNAILQPLGRNAEGLMQYNVHIPRGLDEIKNKSALARQELAIMNKVVQEGANQLINWGKNTQWAGRQLTVGLTVPMMAFGKAAADAFKTADQELTRLTKVYGGLTATSSAELAKVRKDVAATATELSKSYGASFNETLGLAADIAATGKQGNELLGSIQETTRLAVLGEVDRQDAMKATLAIQTAFKQNTEQLSESINFLNAVENQTSTTLADLVEAIPKAGPIIKGLGGSVQDLALYLTAMREGGVSAAEGANALKSALGSLINPTKVATGMFAGFGIDLKSIVQKNAGNVTATILELQSALDTLDPLQKQQALEQLFGKFQFARMNALFSNLGKQGSQTLQVLDLMKASSQDLAGIASRELTQVTESASGKYRRALEGLKADLAGVGEQFLKINTALINIVDGVINFAEKLPGPVKQLLSLMGMFTATAGPLIMLTGVLGNFFGYIIKGVYHFKSLFKGAEGWKLLTPEILAANKAGDLAEQTFYSDARAAAVLKQALDGLVGSYTALETKINAGVINVPMNSPLATVGREVDVTSQYLSPINTRSMSHVRPVGLMSTQEKRSQSLFGVVPGAPLVNNIIGKNPQTYMSSELPPVEGLTSVRGVSTGIVAEEAAQWHAMTAALAMQSKADIKKLKMEVGATGLVTDELSTSYQALLPKMTELIQKATAETAEIVAKVRAGKVSVDAGIQQVMALNAQLEASMATEAGIVAQGLGKTIDVTKVPLLNQPVVDPKTGKSNMKELFKPGRTRELLNKIAGALGVKTYGAPYSIQTTRPKKFNSGGHVFFNDGNIVPGTGNSDTVPAMLTPGEFVVNKESTQKNLPLLQAINGGKGSSGPGYGIGGILGRMSTSRSRDIIESIFGIRARGSEARGFISQIDNISDSALRQRYLDETAAFVNKLTRSRRDPRFYSQTARTLQPRHISDLNSHYSSKGLEPLPYAEPRHDTHLTVSKLLGKGRALVSNYVVDYTAISNLQANANRLKPIDFIKRDLVLVPGINKYRKQLEAAGIPKLQWEEAEKLIDSAITNKFILEASNRGIPIENLPFIGDRPGSKAGFTFTKDVIPTIESVLTSLNPSATHRLAYKKLKENTKLRSRKMNSGGFVSGYAGGGIIPILNSAVKSLANTDPLHGPLQIGRYRAPLTIRNRRQGASIGYKGSWREWTWDKGPRKGETVASPGRTSSVQAFLTGSQEERGRYVTEEYMRGNYDILQIPGAIEAMRVWGQKASGTFHRGITLRGWSKVGGQMPPLPKWLINDIEKAKSTGDFSNLIGKEFIMRRSSWSSNPETARGFGDFQLEANVKNRRVTPASQMFPELDFTTPGSTVKVNESESIFGGKFRIVGGDANGLKIETVSGPMGGKRRFGGAVNAGMPYVVGENGPELFVPRNSGGIIPRYENGGEISKGRRMAAGAARFLPSMLGWSLGSSLTGGSMLGGMAGSMAGDFAGTALYNQLMNVGAAAEGSTKKVSLLSKAFKFLVAMPGPVKVVAALAAIGLTVKNINDRIEEHRRIVTSAFGLEQETVEKLGLKYKTVSDRIGEYRKNLDLLNVSASQYKYSTDKVGGVGLNITQEELDKLKDYAKKSLPTELKMINMASLDEAAQKVTQLKAMFVSAGMSVENANELIYALILNSNKSENALSLLANKGFGGIVDKASAAKTTLETFNNVLGKGNTDQLGASLDSAINAYLNLEDSLVNTSDKTKKIVTQSEAYQQVLDKIKKSSAGNVQIGEQNFEALVKSNEELAKIINSSDTFAGILAKVKLSTTGIRLDLQDMGSSTATALSVVIAKQQEILGSTTGPYSSIIKAISKAGETNADKIIKNAQLSADALRKQIALHEKAIDRIKKEADARKKALDERLSDEDILTQIQKKQLEYQDALASGDMSSAAQAQLDIKQLVQGQQVTLAKRAIDQKAEADIAKEQSRIDELNAKIDGLQSIVDKATASADASSKKAADLTALLNELTALTIAATDGLDDSELNRLKKLSSDLRKAGFTDIANQISSKTGGVITPAKGVEINMGPTKYGIQGTATDTFSKAYNAAKNSINVNDPEVKTAIEALQKGLGLNNTPAGVKETSSAKNIGEAGKQAVSGKATKKIFINDIAYDVFAYKGNNYITPSGGAGVEIYALAANNTKGKRVTDLKRGYAYGGYVRHFGPGGGVYGPGTGTSDSIPAMLSNGEYVVNAASVSKVGVDFMDNINRMAAGGLAKYNIPSMGSYKFATGGIASKGDIINIGGFTFTELPDNPRQFGREIIEGIKMGRGRLISSQ